MPGGAVVVTGLKEFRRDLRKMGAKDSQKELRKGLLAAAKVVAKEAKTRVPSVSGRAKASIRPGADGDRAFVRGGSNAVPYYGWLDFGTRKPQTGNPRRIGPWARSGKGPDHGRFIYAALDAKREEMVAELYKALDALAAKNNL